MKRVVILTGASMSVESGLGTERAAGGLWDSRPARWLQYAREHPRECAC